ncbi:hypothetical protein ACI7YT_12195 [Microbacterium sp. M]|uniref:hypothetical protein n=1 Tax=Microbacterium sp. M TaxID=3377125 RepID=UPI00386D9CDE
MAAHGLAERRATLARLKTINAGRAWQGSVDDDYEVPREPGTGKVLPHTIVDFGAPVRSSRDRNLTNPEKGQPHILPANIACVAGDYDSAQVLMAAVFDLLVDWAPSSTSDPWESKGGYGSRRAATANTPTRHIEGLFLEDVVNQGIDAPI